MIKKYLRHTGEDLDRAIRGTEDDDVCFWDYDGTLIYGCSLEEAQNMTELPTPPDHSNDTVPLTFAEWNYTLADIHALTVKADVGAMYRATDGKNHFFLRITKVTGRTATFNWGYHPELTVDWGDGTVDTIAAKSGQNSFSHDYTDYGTYHVSVMGDGTSYGNPGGNISLLADNSMLVGTAVVTYGGWGWPAAQGTNTFSGSGVEAILLPPTAGIVSASNGGLCVDMAHLRHLNVPRSMAGSCRMGGCTSLRRVSLPYTMENIHECMFSSTGLSEIRLPQNFSGQAIAAVSRFLFDGSSALSKISTLGKISTIWDASFRDCKSLKELVIPETVTKIAANSFSNAGIRDYYFYPTTPPTLLATNAFTGIKNGTIIHVPADSLEAYQTATNWVTYADYMVGDL